MKLSTKSRYGTRAMLDIALNCEQGPVHLRDLADRQGLSMKYLEQIVPSLKAAGLIRSIRGANGGYKLAKDPSKITLLSIVEALEGVLVPVECVGDPQLCSRAPECAVHDIWKEFQGKNSSLACVRSWGRKLLQISLPNKLQKDIIKLSHATQNDQWSLFIPNHLLAVFYLPYINRFIISSFLPYAISRLSIAHDPCDCQVIKIAITYDCYGAIDMRRTYVDRLGIT
ncbi:MAG: Rrf2 family transcriptional regulator [Rubrobacteridae bacterium]|nr:Rrf2 family transcriptional regulator [Rubrobacteridae bacterium]